MGASDFEALLGDQEGQNASFADMGVSTYTPSPIAPPGLSNTDSAITPTPPLSTLQGIFETVKQDSQGAFNWVESEASGAAANTKSVLLSGVHAVESGASSAAGAVTGGLKSIYWYAIIAVVVLGAVVYFAGKSGAVRVSAPI